MKKKAMKRNVSISLAVALTAVAVLSAAAEPSVVVSQSTVAYRAPRTNWQGTNFCVFAAQDIARVLGKTVGREIACVPEEKLPAGTRNVIYVGDTAAAKAAGLDVSGLTSQECILKGEEGRCFIAARTGMGVNNGAVEFLQRFADFYFVSFWGGNEPVVENPSLVIPKHDVKLTPAIHWREVYCDHHLEGYFKACWKNEPDGYRRRMEFMRRQRLFPINAEYEAADRISEQIGSCHSQFDYLKPETYFKDHPEYYAMGVDGKRHGKESDRGQLCYTHPETLKLVTEHMLGFIAADRKKHPTDYPLIYDFTQMDACDRLCECPTCKAEKAKYNRKPGGFAEGGDAGLQLQFVNKIAKRVAAEYPDVLIRIFAYVSTEEVPVGIVPEPNVMIWICDLYGRSDHERPLGEGPLNAKRAQIIRDWSKIAKHVQIWDYMLAYPGLSGLYPEINGRALKGDAAFFRDNGITRVFLESAYKGGAFWDLNAFLAGQFYFNPDRDLDELLDKYCRQFAPAAKEMRRAVDYLLARMAAAPMPRTDGEWSSGGFAWRNVETFDELKRLLDVVYAAQTDPAQKSRVANVLVETCRELLPAYKGDPARADRYAALKKEAYAYMDAYLPYAVMSEGRRKEFRAQFDEMVAMLEVDFADKPAVFKDAKPSDVLAFDYHVYPEWRRKIYCKPDAKSSVGLACVWKPGKHESGVMCGVYDYNDSKVLFAENCKIPDDATEYAWYRMGVSSITSGATVYFTPRWIPNYGVGKYYRACDGMDDMNVWEIWASVRRGEDDTFLFDRVLLRRVPAGTK